MPRADARRAHPASRRAVARIRSVARSCGAADAAAVRLRGSRPAGEAQLRRPAGRRHAGDRLAAPLRCARPAVRPVGVLCGALCGVHRCGAPFGWSLAAAGRCERLRCGGAGLRRAGCIRAAVRPASGSAAVSSCVQCRAVRRGPMRPAWLRRGALTGRLPDSSSDRRGGPHRWAAAPLHPSRRGSPLCGPLRAAGQRRRWHRFRQRAAARRVWRAASIGRAGWPHPHTERAG